MAFASDFGDEAAADLPVAAGELLAVAGFLWKNEEMIEGVGVAEAVFGVGLALADVAGFGFRALPGDGEVEGAFPFDGLADAAVAAAVAEAKGAAFLWLRCFADEGEADATGDALGVGD